MSFSSLLLLRLRSLRRSDGAVKNVRIPDRLGNVLEMSRYEDDDDEDSDAAPYSILGGSL